MATETHFPRGRGRRTDCRITPERGRKELMNLNMNKGLAAVSVAFGLTFMFACTPGGTGTEPDCTDDTDCEGTLQCHPITQTCEEDCTLDDAAACPAEAPVCNGPDADDGTYPLENEDANADQALRLLCVCVVDSDCGDGEICNAATAKCEAGESTEDAGPDPDECTVATVAADCDADQVCVDGTCEDECIDDSCLPAGELCDIDDSVDTYNQCVIAEDLTAGCADAANAPAQAGGPTVIYDVEYIVDTADACGTNGDLSLWAYLVSIYSEVDISGDDAAAVANMYRPGFAANSNKFIDAYSLEAVAGVANEYTVTVEICDPLNEDEAVQFDDDTNTSNAFCWNAQQQ
jgi:hypothetical protein